MTERCTPQNLVLGDSGFGCVYRYHSTKRLEDTLTPQFFLSVRDQVRAGDWIRIFQMENADIQGHKNRVLRFCDVVVIFVSKRGVFLDPSEIREMPVDFAEIEAEAAVPVERTKLVPKWNGPTDMWTVLDPEGVVRAKGIKDRKIAEQIAAGALPLPDAPKRVPTSTPETESATAAF